MSSYCTADEAKSAGATGSAVELTAAILAASERVERYTSELFTPTAQTREVLVDVNGVAHVHKRIKTVTSVSWAGVGSALPVESYRVHSSSTIGGRDTIELVLSYADVTVLGAEPWNGGWANLTNTRDPRVTIVGTFGWDEPPQSVRMATALIAALIRGVDVDAEVPTLRADAEGNVLPVVPQRDSATTPAPDRAPLRSRTTGSAAADALLASYVREPVRMRA